MCCIEEEYCPGSGEGITSDSCSSGPEEKEEKEEEAAEDRDSSEDTTVTPAKVRVYIHVGV